MHPGRHVAGFVCALKSAHAGCVGKRPPNEPGSIPTCMGGRDDWLHRRLPTPSGVSCCRGGLGCNRDGAIERMTSLWREAAGWSAGHRCWAALEAVDPERGWLGAYWSCLFEVVHGEDVSVFGTWRLLLGGREAPVCIKTGEFSVLPCCVSLQASTFIQ